MGFNFDLHSQILSTCDKKCQTLRVMCKVEVRENVNTSNVKNIGHVNTKISYLEGKNVSLKKLDVAVILHTRAVQRIQN